MANRNTVLLLSQIDDCQIEYIFHTENLRHKQPPRPYHEHSVWEIHCIAGGNCRLLLDGTEYCLEKNDVCLIPPGQMHCLFDTEETVRMGFRFAFVPAVHHASSGLMKTYFDTVFSDDRPFYRFSSAEACSSMKKVLFDYPETISDCMAAHLAEIVLLSAAEKIRPLPRPEYYELSQENDSVRIVRTEEYLNENYGRHIRLSEIADIYHLSEKQTSRTLVRLFGKTFSDLLAEKRVGIACYYLERTDMSMEDIASYTGFGTVSYLYRCFKAATGMTPGEYRKQSADGK